MEAGLRSVIAHNHVEDGPEPQPVLKVNGLTKSFGDAAAVNDVCFEVSDGELVALLGPSGCGKTTTLRIIAGLQATDSGRVWLRGVDITELPPHRRNMGIVFQSYALFPHMTVEQNVAFGPRMQRVAHAVRRERVRESLALTQLAGLGHRYPRELSGGQQQRVALARALASKPSLLLLDEPMSNLDARLREQLRLDLRRIQLEAGVATLLVTHDQEEALTMADRLILMNDGHVVEQGRPVALYHDPRTIFAGQFLGNVNVLHGTVIESTEDRSTIECPDGLRLTARARHDCPTGTPVVIVIRQERLRLRASTDSADTVQMDLNVARGVVLVVGFRGQSMIYVCEVGKHRLTARMPIQKQALPEFQVDDILSCEWDVSDALLFPYDIEGVGAASQ